MRGADGSRATFRRRREPGEWLTAVSDVPALNPLAKAVVSLAPKGRRARLQKRLTPIGWVDVPFPGARPIRLWSDNDDLVTREIYRMGLSSYEPDTLPLAVALARRATVIVDVGAHIGTFTLSMAVANGNAQIFAFEPVAAVFDRLMKNVTNNGMKGVVCVAAAVAEEAGQTPLFSPAGRVSTVASRVPRHRLSYREEPYQCQIVPSIRLDTFLAGCDIGSVDLVKIDVEQAELGVLRGMGSLLEARPHVICEVFPAEWTGLEHAAEMERLVGDLGYNVFLLRPHGPIQRDRVVGDAVHWNQLFTTLEAAEVTALFRAGRAQLSG